MSHEATNWAIKVRGLKPAAKLVLWHLADRFNPDYGCFPCQERLAEDCEISRSTLNTHLNTLEGAGLIVRRQRLGKGRRQATTMYFLDFDGGREGDFCTDEGEKLGGADEQNFGESGAQNEGNEGRETASDPVEKSPEWVSIPCPKSGHGVEKAVSENGQKPCPENGKSRVRNPDTNPVREPVREPVTLSSTVSDDEIGVEREISPSGEKGLDGNTDHNAASHPVDGIRTVKDADKDRRFWAAFDGYPRLLTSSKQPAWQAWVNAGADIRSRVTPERVQAFLALCKRDGVNHPPAISTVLGEGMLFTDGVDALLVRSAPAEDGGDDGKLRLAPWSKEWMIVRLALLRKGAKPGFDDSTDLTRNRRRFPLVYQMDHGPRLEVPRSSLPADAVAASVQLGVTNPAFERWQDFHRVMDWPVVPVSDTLKSAWFPCADPADWKHYAACMGPQPAETNNSDTGDR